MTKDEKRILKLATCSEVSFTARDADGDYTSVDIKGENAQTILDFLKTYIVKANSSEGTKSFLKDKITGK